MTTNRLSLSKRPPRQFGRLSFVRLAHCHFCNWAPVVSGYDTSRTEQ